MTDTEASSSPRPSHPHLAELLGRAEVVDARVRELAEQPLPDLARKPSPQAWSALECVDHLRVTGHLYYPGIHRALEETRRRDLRSDAPYRPSLLGRFFLRFVDPESRKKLKAPAIFRPSQSDLDPRVIEQFLEQQRELCTLIREADGLQLNGVKLATPVSRLIRFTIGDALSIMVAHQERHLRQAQEALPPPPSQ